MADGLQKLALDAPEMKTGFARVRAAIDKLDKRQKGFATLAAVIGACALGAGLHWSFIGSHYVSTENAYVGAASAQMSSQVAGVIAEVPVSATQAVRAGDVLAVIDPTDAELGVAQAEAEYRRTLQRVRQYYAQEAAAAAQARASDANLSRAQTDFERRRELAATGAISGEELTAARAAYDAARANQAAARNTLAASSALTQGAGVDTHPETQAAAAALETARLALARTIVRAPIDGIVAQLQAQVGQRVQPGAPLMIVTPIQQAYVDANFKEGQLRNVRIGQPVELRADLYGDRVTYHGRVEGIGGGTGSAFAVIPAQNATGNWIKVVQRVPVRIALDPAELAANPLRVGLSMHATIDVSAD